MGAWTVRLRLGLLGTHGAELHEIALTDVNESTRLLAAGDFNRDGQIEIVVTVRLTQETNCA